MPERRVIIPDIKFEAKEEDSEFLFPPEAAHYLSRVLRIPQGEEIELCNGRDESWLVEVDYREDTNVWGRIRGRLPSGESLFPIYLAQALPKGDRFEQILQRGTELGVASFFPFTSSRCIVRIKAEKVPKKLARWQKIAREAARQSQRTYSPEVYEPISIKELSNILPPNIPQLICWEGETAYSLRDWLAEHPPHLEGIAIIIGPEGGFSREEVESLQEKGGTSIGLGPLILRTETAGPALTAILQFLFGPLGSCLDKATGDFIL